MVGEAHRSISNVSNHGLEVSTIPTETNMGGELDFVFPVPGKSRRDIIGVFGEPRGGGTRKHQGIDIAAPRGKAVVAAVDGVVTKVKEGGMGGKQVWMEDLRKEYVLFYAHLHDQLVREGQKVRQGDVLGTVGNTGNARGSSPHLHFEILTMERESIDPSTLLP